MRTVLLSVLLVGVCWGQGPLNEAVITKDVQAQYRRNLAAMLEAHKANKDMFVRNGVVADRKKRTVRILAFSTGLGKGSPVEYVLVGVRGKDYESLTVTMAKAVDVHEALEFIGMKAGHTVRNDKFLLWPKGERVSIRFSWTNDEKKHLASVEEMMVFGKEPYPKRGWLFGGSYTSEVNGKEVYLGDDTGDIISTFNSPWTVIDVAGSAAQAEVYGSVVPNPKNLLKMRTPVEITISPVLPPGQSRIVDYKLSLLPGKDGTTAKADDILVNLFRKSDAKDILQKAPFKTMLTTIAPDAQAKKDIFFEIHADDKLTREPLAGFFQVFKQLTMRGIFKVDPSPGELFYESFLPDPDWYKPDGRPQQPIELHFSSKPDGKILLRWHQEIFQMDGSLKLKRFMYRFSTVQGLNKILAAREDWETNSLLFYVTPTTTYGEMKKWYALLRDKYPIIYIFADKDGLADKAK